jgi:hypothetical protein
MSIAWPGPLRTPVIDPDGLSRDRIKKWLRENDLGIYGDYDGEVDEDDIVKLLLDYEKFLVAEELKLKLRHVGTPCNPQDGYCAACNPNNRKK